MRKNPQTLTWEILVTQPDDRSQTTSVLLASKRPSIPVKNYYGLTGIFEIVISITLHE